MQAIENKKWAKDIVRMWGEGTYTNHYGYRLACDALGMEAA